LERKQNNTRETAECRGNRTIQERQQNVTEHNTARERDSRMPRKQNNTTETAECHGTQHCKRERQQNAKETEQYNRDNTRFVERQELAAFKFIMSKQCRHVGIDMYHLWRSKE